MISVLGIANNGFYNRLYTLTGQVSLPENLLLCPFREELNLDTKYYEIETPSYAMQFVDEEEEKFGTKVQKVSQITCVL